MEEPGFSGKNDVGGSAGAADAIVVSFDEIFHGVFLGKCRFVGICRAAHTLCDRCGIIFAVAVSAEYGVCQVFCVDTPVVEPLHGSVPFNSHSPVIVGDCGYIGRGKGSSRAT